MLKLENTTKACITKIDGEQKIEIIDDLANFEKDTFAREDNL
jgi:hypothetical protein